MNKGIVLFILVLTVAGVFYAKSVSQTKRQSQMALAKEIRKAMDAMMVDFREARSTTIQGVPADGQWHHRVSFNKGGKNVVRYEVTSPTHELMRTEGDLSQFVPIARSIAGLNIRRQPGVLDVLEVQVQAKNQVELVSNFKIRTRD